MHITFCFVFLNCESLGDSLLLFQSQVPFVHSIHQKRILRYLATWLLGQVKGAAGPFLSVSTPGRHRYQSPKMGH